MLPDPDINWFHRLCHWLGWWCGVSFGQDKYGEPVMKMRCKVCMKANLIPEAWERIRSL